MKASIEKFLDSAQTFRCPICGSGLHPAGRSLQCPRNHTFDIAAKGSVALLRSRHTQDGLYNQPFFENRSALLSTGLYDHIVREVAHDVSLLLDSPASSLLDVGCGDGTLTKRLQNLIASAPVDSPQQQDQALHELTVFACDISQPAISIAARGNSSIRWFIADLAKLPIADSSMDIVTDIFSPANYEEFKRVLRPQGKLIKVVPGKHHLMELRRAIADSHAALPKDYSNDDVMQGIEQHCTIQHSTLASATLHLDNAQWRQFLAMTPLMFHVDKSSIDLDSLRNLTIEAQIVQATMK
ncbi:putative RNA methyltransferase [Bifidobacterium aquikefiricola]|uniref:Methyltransferase domain-containing protein n=1 Tax=Bifidobacterium aquikefiricola TaxID=3059038 RepID=A0AB39U630_9BIFI